ncbi:interferon-induced helicase C domain-containing protein 1 isoform X2 [Bufo bufo]|uniref:interferon-induced helicase C domain-containing protein 1 isoform X2 n=1 Tax=Bufo bufo TaxID=8384 RepID=UPI001ABDECBE|nr:interferon-induced helicase C domain-containing protein 1 isoform X2 [Bufo bufo]
MQQDNSNEIHENMIVMFRSRICSHIQVIPVLDYMHSLDQEFKEVLRARAATENQEAARMLLDRLLSETRRPNWFEEFVTAVREAECTQAEMYLSPENLPPPQKEAKYDYCEKLISWLSPRLLKKLEPKETTAICLSKEICSQEDADIINGKQNAFDANRELLSRITKKKDWFKVFVAILNQLGRMELIKELTGGTYEEFIDGAEEMDVDPANHKSNCLDDSTHSEVTDRQNDSHDVTGESSVCEMSYSECSDLDSSFSKSTDSPDCSKGSVEENEHSMRKGRASPVPKMTLRDYQMEVAKPALDGENIIICLPTGSGKTRVAVYIARHHLDERKKNGLPAKVIVLVNKVPLVDQHFRSEFYPYMKDCYHVIKISGDCQLKISFPDVVKKHDVIICTAQILENSLMQAEEDEEEGVQLSDVSLLIIDECHHTQKGGVYNNIMLRYMQQKKENKKLQKLQKPVVPLPQILGLTASPGVGGANNSKKAEEHILKICANLDSRIKTVQENIAQLQNQVKQPYKQIEIAEDNNKNPFGDKIKDMMKSIETFSDLYPPNDHGSQSYEQWVVQKMKTAAKEENRRQHVCAHHLKKYNDALQIYDTIRMSDAFIHLLKFYTEEKKRAIMLNESDGASLSEKIDETDRFLMDLFFEHKKELEQLSEKEEYENEKLIKLRRSIMEEFTRNSKARGIIFTKTRQSAVALSEWIGDNEKFKEVGVRAHYIIGAGGNSDYKSMTQNEQKKVIQKFKNGELNLLIATSVAEEGLDIKECNIVIVYGCIHNEIAMVQARGRARAEESAVVLVASRSSGAIDHDSVNVYRENLMHKAIQKVQTMDPKIFAEKIQEFQKQTIVERKVKKKKDLQKVYQKNPGKVTFWCIKCQSLVCSGLDIRVIEDMHHVVLDQKFKKRYKKWENKTLQEKFADYQTNGEIICNNCGRPWGTIMVHKGTEVPCLKICNFVIKYEDEKMTKDTLDVWRDLPIKFRQFSFLSDDSDSD